MNKKSIDINKESKGSYAEVHGLKLYYEIHGSGRPLVLLHGGLSTSVDIGIGAEMPPIAVRMSTKRFEE